MLGLALTDSGRSRRRLLVVSCSSSARAIYENFCFRMAAHYVSICPVVPAQSALRGPATSAQSIDYDRNV